MSWRDDTPFRFFAAQLVREGCPPCSSRTSAGPGTQPFVTPDAEPEAGSGPSLCSPLQHPARGYALESLPRTGLVSPALTRRSCTDEQ